MNIQIGVWREWKDAGPLLAAELERRQCRSASDYVAAAPQADLLELTRALDVHGVHSGHLLRRLWEEAAETGELGRCARDLLVRALCARLSCRERVDHLALHLEDAFFQWANQIPINYRFVERNLLAAMLQVPPPMDWLPTNADDSILVGLFSLHWPAEEPGRRYRLVPGHGGGLAIEHDAAERSTVAGGEVMRDA